MNSKHTKSVYLLLALIFMGCQHPKPHYKHKPKHKHVKYVKQTPEYLKPIDLRGLSCGFDKAVIVDLANGTGRFVACEDYMVTRNGPVTGGRPGIYDTPKGEFTVQWKAKEWDSKTYPSEDGNRNMDYALFVTNEGVALHAGSVKMLSHGCVHLRRADARYLYENFKAGDPVYIN